MCSGWEGQLYEHTLSGQSFRLSASMNTDTRCVTTDPLWSERKITSIEVDGITKLSWINNKPVSECVNSSSGTKVFANYCQFKVILTGWVILPK